MSRSALHILGAITSITIVGTLIGVLHAAPPKEKPVSPAAAVWVDSGGTTIGPVVPGLSGAGPFAVMIRTAEATFVIPLTGGGYSPNYATGVGLWWGDPLVYFETPDCSGLPILKLAGGDSFSGSTLPNRLLVRQDLVPIIYYSSWSTYGTYYGASAARSLSPASCVYLDPAQVIQGWKTDRQLELPFYAPPFYMK